MTELGQLTLLRASAVLQVAVQRSIDLVAFGLHGAETASPEDLTIPDTIGVIAANDRRLSVEEARSEFRSWVLAGGLRDCVEALGSALEWARKESVLWSFPGTVTRGDDGGLHLSATITGGVWNQQMIEAARRFERLPLPEKIDRLSRLNVARPAFTEDILRLNAARNCLSHRGGVVGREDLMPPDDAAMEVTWRRLALSAMAGSQARAITIGSTVEAGEEVHIGVEAVSRTYPLGERIVLSASDFADIALTFVLYAQQLEASIRGMQEARFVSSEGK